MLPAVGTELTLAGWSELEHGESESASETADGQRSRRRRKKPPGSVVAAATVGDGDTFALNVGLALLRLEELQSALNGNISVATAGSDHRMQVMPILPDWWEQEH